MGKIELLWCYAVVRSTCMCLWLGIHKAHTHMPDFEKTRNVVVCTLVLWLSFILNPFPKRSPCAEPKCSCKHFNPDSEAPLMPPTHALDPLYGLHTSISFWWVSLFDIRTRIRTCGKCGTPGIWYWKVFQIDTSFCRLEFGARHVLVP